MAAKRIRVKVVAEIETTSANLRAIRRAHSIRFFCGLLGPNEQADWADVVRIDAEEIKTVAKRRSERRGK